jgi:hypothetical protein
MTDRTQDKTHGVVGDIKSALRGIKGTGDAIRGTVNESVDTAFNDKQGEVTNKAIKEKGISDMQAADQRLNQPQTTGAHTTGTHTTGVHPSGAHDGLKTGGVTGGTRTATAGTTTGAGAHSGAVGNMGSAAPTTRQQY